MKSKMSRNFYIIEKIRDFFGTVFVPSKANCIELNSWSCLQIQNKYDLKLLNKLIRLNSRRWYGIRVEPKFTIPAQFVAGRERPQQRRERRGLASRRCQHPLRR